MLDELSIRENMCPPPFCGIQYPSVEIWYHVFNMGNNMIRLPFNFEVSFPVVTIINRNNSLMSC